MSSFVCQQLFLKTFYFLFCYWLLIGYRLKAKLSIAPSPRVVNTLFFIFLLFFIKTDTISKIAHCACLKSLCNYMTDTLLQLCYRCPIPRRYGKLQCFYTVRFLLRDFRYHNKLYCSACFHSAVIGGDIVV